VARDDLLARARQEGRTAVGPRELVPDYATTAPDRPLVEFVHLVGHHPVPLGVVDDEGRLLGVVPRAAVLDALAAVPARREG
jgi:glycine betaine/proline transport system ATP-binding protein